MKAAQQCKQCRTFAKKFDIENFYDVGEMGIEHALLPEKGLVAPGETVADIGTEDKIALVNEGSFQHIVLAMQCKETLGEAHALDENISAMAHPDGMSALIAGSVSCQLTTSPFTFKEEAEGMSEVGNLADVWPEGNSFIVLCATEKLHDDNPELYDAVVAACAEAISWINDNPQEAAELLCEDEGVDAETMLSWLEDPACVYNTQLKGVMDFHDFMAENDFLEVDPAEDISDLAFDNVKGKKFIMGDPKSCSMVAGEKPTGLPKENIMEFRFSDGSKLIARPSGTEPKLKVYLFARARDMLSAEKIISEMEKNTDALICKQIKGYNN